MVGYTWLFCPFTTKLLVFEISLIRNINSIQEVPQFFGAGGVAEFAEGFGFDLADAFAGDVEFFADFLEGSGAAVFDAETEAQDFFFSWG